LKKGDIVRFTLHPDDGLYVVVKGPYESSFVVTKYLTETRLVVDLYGEEGLLERVPPTSLEIVTRS
jgi:hypothetical protein